MRNPLNLLNSTTSDPETLADLGGMPPMGPNSFVFAYFFIKKHLCQRSTPPTENPGSTTEKEAKVETMEVQKYERKERR